MNREMGTNNTPATGLTLEKTLFGTMPGSTPVDKYKLTNAHQMEVSILTYGGIVQSIVVPDRHGKLRDVALGFDDLEDYLTDSPYFGAIIGRFGNRIAKGQFRLGGKQYQIPTNDGNSITEAADN